MLLKQGRTIELGRLVRALALGLVVLCGALLTACADDQDAPATEGPTATSIATAAPSVAPTVAPATSQPTQEAARPEPTPTDSGAAGPSVSTPTVKVVTSTNFVGDWARIVGGDRAEVFAMLPPGQDPHSFSPGGQDVARVADADVVFTVGLSLEAEWLYDLLRNASADESKLIALGEFVDPIESTGPDPHGHGGDDHGETMSADDHSESAVMGRLLIGDGEEGQVSVVDLETGEVDQDHFDLGSRAGRIYSTQNGRYAIAVSSDANAANLFDGGIFMEAHGDHFDLVEAPTQRLDIDLAGDRPVHLYVGKEWATIFYDGSGEVALINEHDLEDQGSDYVPLSFNAGPQHGAAVPMEDDLFAVSLKHPDYPANPDARNPIGAEIRDVNGDILYTAHGCPDLHGDAGNGHQAVFGCTGGALAVEAHGGEYSHVFVTAPEGSLEDFRLTSVWGYPGLDHFFALGSEVGLYVVDPEEGSMEQIIPAAEGLRPIQVNLTFDGKALLVVMSDGELRMYDAHDLDMLASSAGLLTTPVETGFWARPHLATAPGAVFITDSVGGQVLQLDSHDLAEVGHWDVSGSPTKIAYVGIVGGEGGGNDEHDDHGHDHGPLDPHFWFDPVRVKIAVNEIAAQLSALDPEGATVYQRNAADYGKQLDELHAWILEQVEVVQPERRLLVTSHDTFAYFAKAYGFEVVGLVIPSLGPDLEPSGEHLADVIEVVREHGVPAVFGETTVSERLAQAVAMETGAELVQLYSGSMGVEGSSGDTYLGMVRTNVERIVEALK